MAVIQSHTDMIRESLCVIPRFQLISYYLDDTLLMEIFKSIHQEMYHNGVLEQISQHTRKCVVCHGTDIVFRVCPYHTICKPCLTIQGNRVLESVKTHMIKRGLPSNWWRSVPMSYLRNDIIPKHRDTKCPCCDTDILLFLAWYSNITNEWWNVKLN